VHAVLNGVGWIDGAVPSVESRSSFHCVKRIAQTGFRDKRPALHGAAVPQKNNAALATV